MQILTSGDTRHFEDVRHLVEANWGESRIPVPLDLDSTRNTYTQLGEAGLLFTAVAYDGDDAVGYAIVVKTPHMLNHNVLTINVSGFYISPTHRRGKLLTRLMGEVRQYARQSGGHHIMWHAPAGSSFERALDDRFAKINSYFMERVQCSK